jgi:hypothetical protein
MSSPSLAARLRGRSRRAGRRRWRCQWGCLRGHMEDETLERFSGERRPAQMNDAAAPAIQIERPVIATEDGRSFDGYLARLANGRGPGLVIFSEMWGVAPSKTEMAEDYAKRGWCA